MMPSLSPRACFCPSMIKGMESEFCGKLLTLVLGRFCLEIGQQMTEFYLLGAQVMNIGVTRRNFQRDALGDIRTVYLQAGDLTRIVSQQRDLFHTQIAQDLRA